jgi:hypothetical protein
VSFELRWQWKDLELEIVQRLVMHLLVVVMSAVVITQCVKSRTKKERLCVWEIPGCLGGCLSEGVMTKEGSWEKRTLNGREMKTTYKAESR